ncbi:hypothetical protein [Staphylococcus phage vB_SsapH-Golestan-100]|nr:hypothetical protein [Staphylococcus phage vB_SsapH-Golestan-100]
MKITFNTHNEELKQVQLKNSDFQIWLDITDFENLEDFEDNYNSEDVYSLIDHLDLRELKEGKSFYKIV